LLGVDGFMDTNVMSITITSLDELYNEYLYYHLSYIGLSQFADTTSIPQINNKHIKPIKFLKPKKEEQEAIAGVLSAMDEEIAALEQRLAKTKAMKQGMMQELLTGRTRLV
jgi:type I restriction enzyme S subunit